VGDFEPSTDGRVNSRLGEVPPAMPAGVSLDRWSVYKAVQALGEPGQSQSAFEALRQSLTDDLEGTFERLGELPERHPGEGLLVKPLLEALYGCDLPKAAELLENFRENEFIYRMLSANLAATTAQDPMNQAVLYEWWKNQAKNEALARSTSVAALEMIRAEKSTEQSIKNHFEKAVELPEGAMRAEVLQQIVSATFPDQLELAENLLIDLPGDLNFDPAIADFAYQACEHDPAAALLWSETIQAPELRETVFLSITTRWNQADPASLQEWLRKEGGELDHGLSGKLKVFLED